MRLNLCEPESECTDEGFAGRTWLGVTVDAEDGVTSGEAMTLPFFGADVVSLPPEVPPDMLGALLGALLGGRVDGVLWPPQSLSDAVGDDADDVEPFLSMEVVDERAEASFCRVPRVCPGCLS